MSRGIYLIAGSKNTPMAEVGKESWEGYGKHDGTNVYMVVKA